MSGDGIALLKHAAPVGGGDGHDRTESQGDDEDLKDRFNVNSSLTKGNWETAWTVQKQGTALTTPKSLPVRFGSSNNSNPTGGATGAKSTQAGGVTGAVPNSPSAATISGDSSRQVEEENVSVILGRNSHVELDLVVAEAGRYYFAFDLKPSPAKREKQPSFSNCCTLATCFPSTEVVSVTVQLLTLDHLGTTEASAIKIMSGFSKHPMSTSGAALVKTEHDVRLMTQFILTRTESHGRFKFDLADSHQHYRLRAVLSTSKFNINNPKEVFVKLNRRKVPDYEMKVAGSAMPHASVDLQAQKIRRHVSSSFASVGDSVTAQHPFFGNDTFHKFVSYLGHGLRRQNTRLLRAGSETFHEVGGLMATQTVHEGHSDTKGTIPMIPLRTKRDGFFEDLTALEYFMTRSRKRSENSHDSESSGEDISEVWDRPVAYGRNVILRGVNLSGNTKLPIGCATELPEYSDRLKDREFCRTGITFVGRPFPLEDADVHLARIARWGFNCLRFLVTWEAIEHGGPGEHDVAYLDYVEEVVRRAGEYGLYVFIDPHQDVWSRFTGGSGAPAWTLELCGLDITKLQASEAAFTHHASSPTDPLLFRKMIWPQNYQRFAALHMFALFFAGKQFAPDFTVSPNWKPGTNPEDVIPGEVRVNVQEFMQSRFLESMRQVAIRMAKFSHVLGFDTFNEPSAGFIGKKLDHIPERVIPPGRVFRPIDAMACAAGLSVSVKVANGIGLLTSSDIVNVERVSAWLPGRTDIWQRHGVWRRIPATSRSSRNSNNSNGNLAGSSRDDESYELLKPNYFLEKEGSTTKWNYFKDFLLPFAQKYQSMLREVRPSFMIFLEGDAFGHEDFYWPSDDKSGGVVNATHWYDGITLFMRKFNPSMTIDVQTSWPVIGRTNVKNMHIKALSHIKSLPRDPVALTTRVQMPTLIGEFGCPFDLNDSIGLRTGDFSSHIEALSSYYAIFDQLQLSSTQWNYATENSNLYGDHWNLENLSIFSPEQRTDASDPDSGARALRGFSRPYAPIVAGTRLAVHFDHEKRWFSLRYFPSKANFECGDPLACTVIYLPDCQFLRDGEQGLGDTQFANRGLNIEVKNATYVMEKLPRRHMLYVWATAGSGAGVFEPVEVRVT